MPTASQHLSLGSIQEAVQATQTEMREAGFADRFWRKDPSLWPGGDAKDVAGMLGWVDVVAKMRERLSEITDFVDEIKAAGFERVIVAGMGGSSLAPYVFSHLFKGGLPVSVMDSTHPATVLEVERGGDLSKTLVIVASKSGSTAEPSAFDAYLFAKVGKPENFVAITDPGSPFQASAEKRGYRKIFLNYADIGGRYSALSFFGLVPAALMGADMAALLDSAEATIAANRSDDGDAFALGAAIGTAAREGKDKLTFLTAPEWASYGLWLEQLIAESTGKKGTGILPIAGEAAGTNYGDDRFFALYGVESPVKDAPSVSIDFTDPYGIAGEMFRWEIATAVAGHVLGINPFDQPNVQESKDVTKAILKTVEDTGSLPEETPSVVQDGVMVLTESEAGSLGDAITAFLDAIPEHGYLAIHAYLHETPELDAKLHALQAALRDRTGKAVTFGYGPRFLHSTGQFHKGGPKVGSYLQLLDVPREDAPIPGQKATWAVFVEAQARGDRQALQEKDRPVMTLSLGIDPLVGLAIVEAAL
ncbi:glucose-6-phosphate isomerase [bacterium]|nr:MAG: glucose-6-phosphate isomerase [bacterium]